MIRKFLIIIVTLFPVVLSAQTTRQLWADVYQFNQLYDDGLVQFKPYLDRISKSEKSADMYFLAYGLDGAISMFEATECLDYLDYSLGWVENVIEAARPVCKIPDYNADFRGCYMGWVSPMAAKKPGETVLKEVSLYECYFFRYVTRMLKVMSQDKSLMENPYYKGKFETIRDFVEKNVWEKWYSRGEGHVFRGVTYISAHWALIALNLSLITQKEDKSEYHHILNKYNQKFRRQAPLYDSTHTLFSWVSATWDDEKKCKEPNCVQDVSHGNAIIAYMVEARDNCIEWKNRDMEGIYHMFFDLIWANPLKPEDCFDKGVDCFGYDKDKKPKAPGTGKFQSDGWIKLGRYYIEIYEFYKRPEILAQINYVPTHTFNVYAHMALNARKLISQPYSNCNKFSNVKFMLTNGRKG
jgi:hypothetical protein